MLKANIQRQLTGQRSTRGQRLPSAQNTWSNVNESSRGTTVHTRLTCQARGRGGRWPDPSPDEGGCARVVGVRLRWGRHARAQNRLVFFMMR